ncbi:MAG TPA: SDR family oxidoreductase [Dehalococcoidia bacterium]|nr:SDR family oxidoreductase [Dehalococcoidia bacterium]
MRWPGIGVTSLGLLVGGGIVGREVIRRRRAMDLSGKVVLVTGSSRGLGFVLAQEFARRGSSLVMCARNESVLREAQREVESLGAEVLAEPCDVGNPAQVEKLVAAAVDRFGRIDVVVNNAGVITMSPFEMLDRADFEEAMDSMFWGVYNTTSAVLPEMRRRKEGTIVNITSIGGKVAAPHLLPYTSAKSAAVGFSEGLHAEVARDGVRVVTVVPGFMRTGSHVNARFKGKHRWEYAWFSLLATLPLTSTDAQRAARRIVMATRLGETEVIVTPQAQLAARLHGAMPGLVVDIASAVGRLLPSTEGNDITKQPALGKESETPVSASFLTSLGRRAAERFNQNSSPQPSQLPE